MSRRKREEAAWLPLPNQSCSSDPYQFSRLDLKAVGTPSFATAGGGARHSLPPTLSCRNGVCQSHRRRAGWQHSQHGMSVLSSVLPGFCSINSPLRISNCFLGTWDLSLSFWFISEAKVIWLRTTQSTWIYQSSNVF